MNRLKSRGLFSESAVYLVSNIINAAIPFALLPVLTRYMSPGEYGQVAMYQTLLAALAAVTGVSVHGAAVVKYFDDDITHVDLGHFIGACLQVRAGTTAVVFVVAFLVRVPLAAWLGLQTEWVLWAVVASAAGFVIQMRLSQWQVRGEAVKYGALQVVQSLANAALSLLLVVVLMQGPRGRIDAQNWVLMAICGISLFLLARDRLIGVSWHAGHFREALRFGVPLIPHVAGMFLLNAVDRMMINAQLGLAQAGVYMVGVQLTMAMPIVFSAINTAYAPWLYERLKANDPSEKRRIVKWTYAYFLIVLVLAGAAFVVGPPIVSLVAGSRYAAAGKTVGWLALGQAFGGMYLMVTNYIFYSKRTGALSLATIGSGLLNVALLYFMIGRLGLPGAAMAFALATAIRFGLTWWVAQRRHPMPWFDLTSAMPQTTPADAA